MPTTQEIPVEITMPIIAVPVDELDAGMLLYLATFRIVEAVEISNTIATEATDL